MLPKVDERLTGSGAPYVAPRVTPLSVLQNAGTRKVEGNCPLHLLSELDRPCDQANLTPPPLGRNVRSPPLLRRGESYLQMRLC